MFQLHRHRRLMNYLPVKTMVSETDIYICIKIIICYLIFLGLYRLAINENPLETIHEEAFYGLDNTLWELELKQDRLAAVPSRALRYLQKLRLLDLSGKHCSSSLGSCIIMSLIKLYSIVYIK